MSAGAAAMPYILNLKVLLLIEIYRALHEHLHKLNAICSIKFTGFLLYYIIELT